jgi:hypothetical protein
MKTFDEFLRNPYPGGETVELSRDLAWIRFNPETMRLDGEFTTSELLRIIMAFEPPPK